MPAVGGSCVLFLRSISRYRSLFLFSRPPDCSILAQLRESLAQTLRVIDVVPQRCEPSLPVPDRCLSYAIQRVLQGVPALCPGLVLLLRIPLAGSLPSTLSAGLIACPLFEGFFGTTVPSDCLVSFIDALLPWDSHRGPSLLRRRSIPGSPGSRSWRFRACSGSWTTPGQTIASRYRRPPCCLPHRTTASAPGTLAAFRG
jgi:hypothetical protein